MSMGDKGGGKEVTIQQPEFRYAPFSTDIIKRLHGLTLDQLDQPLHPLQQESLERQEALARAGGTLTPLATDELGNIIRGGMVNPALDETRRIALGGDVGTNPYLEATYERAARPLLENLTETVNPNIDISAASAGRTGGGMHALLRNKAGEETSRALTDLATNIYGGAYEADQARRMAALGQLGGLGQQDVANRLAAAGAAPGFDAARFADAERLYQLGAAEQGAPYDLAQRYANFIATVPNTIGGTTTTKMPGTPWSSELFSGALGLGQLGLTGYGLSQLGPLAGMAMLSDERAKEDIEPVGITFGGTPIYRYRYRDEYGGGPPQFGVLAQDVAERQPEAVVPMPDGLLGVDYRKVA